jgi:translation initiation factor 2 beta subunit (eIF-2beta)/eIF-5
MNVVCPLCCSPDVQCAVVTELILVCGCDACGAQFTIQKPIDKNPTVVRSPSLRRPLH